MRWLKYCKKIHQTPQKSGYNTHTVNEDGGASPLEIFGFKYPSLQQGQLLSELLHSTRNWCLPVVEYGAPVFVSAMPESSKDFGKVQ